MRGPPLNEPYRRAISRRALHVRLNGAVADQDSHAGRDLLAFSRVDDCGAFEHHARRLSLSRRLAFAAARQEWATRYERRWFPGLFERGKCTVGVARIRETARGRRGSLTRPDARDARGS